MSGTWEQPPPGRVSPPLARHVTQMFGYSAHGLVPGVHRGLPSDRLTLVLSLDRPLVTAPTEAAWETGVRDAHWVSVGGLHTRPAMVEQPGKWRGVQLYLSPLGLRDLLGVPAADLPVESWDAADLFGPDLDRVVEELHAAPDWPTRYAAVDAFLGRQASRVARGADPRRTAPEVQEAWRLLTSRPGLSVASVADTVGYSRRRLTQLLRAEVGHGPKTVQRLARFDLARRLVSRHGVPRLAFADVAARAGYYDQSHLVHDFRQFTGLAPSDWLAAEFPNFQALPEDRAASSSS